MEVYLVNIATSISKQKIRKVTIINNDKICIIIVGDILHPRGWELEHRELLLNGIGKLIEDNPEIKQKIALNDKKSGGYIGNDCENGI